MKSPILKLSPDFFLTSVSASAKIFFQKPTQDTSIDSDDYYENFFAACDAIPVPAMTMLVLKNLKRFR